MHKEPTVMVVKGTLIHTPVFGEVESIENALVVVDGDGKISSVRVPGSENYANDVAAAKANNHLIELTDRQYLLPGLVDLHIHAPQWPHLGIALHLPLYDWLQQYTFPLEAKYENLAFARRNYESLVNNLLANGTTTAMYYGTVHLEATKLLAEICLDKGQRAVIGKCMTSAPMGQN